MEPTPRALELAGPIHGALSDISRTLKLPRAFEPGEAAGVVRIATIDLHQTTLLPALDLAIAPILAGAPDLRVEPLWRDRLVTLARRREGCCGSFLRPPATCCLVRRSLARVDANER